MVRGALRGPLRWKRPITEGAELQRCRLGPLLQPLTLRRVVIGSELQTGGPDDWRRCRAAHRVKQVLDTAIATCGTGRGEGHSWQRRIGRHRALLLQHRLVQAVVPLHRTAGCSLSLRQHGLMMPERLLLRGLLRKPVAVLLLLLLLPRRLIWLVKPVVPRHGPARCLLLSLLRLRRLLLLNLLLVLLSIAVVVVLVVVVVLLLAGVVMGGEASAKACEPCTPALAA